MVKSWGSSVETRGFPDKLFFWASCQQLTLLYAFLTMVLRPSWPTSDLLKTQQICFGSRSQTSFPAFMVLCLNRKCLSLSLHFEYFLSRQRWQLYCLQTLSFSLPQLPGFLLFCILQWLPSLSSVLVVLLHIVFVFWFAFSIPLSPNPYSPMLEARGSPTS